MLPSFRGLRDGGHAHHRVHVAGGDAGGLAAAAFRASAAAVATERLLGETAHVRRIAELDRGERRRGVGQRLAFAIEGGEVERERLVAGLHAVGQQPAVVSPGRPRGRPARCWARARLLVAPSRGGTTRNTV